MGSHNHVLPEKLHHSHHVVLPAILSVLSRVLSCTGSVLSTHSCLATSLTVQASEFYNVVGRCASLGRVQKKQWTLTPAEGTNQFITIAYTHTKETRCVCARVCVCDSVCVIVCV